MTRSTRIAVSGLFLLFALLGCLAAVPAAADDSVLRLQDRFELRTSWTDFEGRTGVGMARAITRDTGAFWFFGAKNLEVVVKVLDGRPINGHFWVFYGSLSNVEFSLEVIDTTTGEIYPFFNPLGSFGSFGDPWAIDASASKAGQPAAKFCVPPSSEPLPGEFVSVEPDTIVANNRAIGLPGGDWMMIWREGTAYQPASGTDTSGTDTSGRDGMRGTIAGRVMSIDLSSGSDVFVVNEIAEGHQSAPGVSLDAAGERVLVAWREGVEQEGLSARVLDTAGAPLSQQVALDDPCSGVVTVSETNFRPSVARRHSGSSGGNSGGSVESGWHVLAVTGSGLGLFEISGAGEVETSSCVAEEDISDLVGPHVTPTGDVLVGWSTGQGLDTKSYFRRYSAGAAVDAPVLLTDDQPIHPPGAAAYGGPNFGFWNVSRNGAVETLVFLRESTPTINVVISKILADDSLEFVHRIRGVLPSEIHRTSGGRWLLMSWSDECLDLGTFWRSVQLFDEDFRALMPRKWVYAASGFFPDNRTLGVVTETRAQSYRPGRLKTFDPDSLVSSPIRGRFEIEVTWRDFDGNTGTGHQVNLTEDTAAFWFFGLENLEVIVKILDGSGLNGHDWLFYASLTNVEFTLKVTDTMTGQIRTYRNDLGQFASAADIEAF